ncbi:putative quinol monooxygenase [Paraburkholderia sp. J12]|uniref:putative quinol monooxygenase n=1 Tax=Paraburkholderia sp. J12 TaxID=2805432 RepID=UPI002ABE3792|nr:putative quinol monooxygenase [Paraburkholderia sp. J12]
MQTQSDSRFRTVAILKTRPENAAELREHLLALVDPSRQDEGCITYILHEAINRPGVFVFYEGWEDEAAIDAHIATDKLQRLKEITDRLLIEPEDIYYMNILK